MESDPSGAQVVLESDAIMTCNSNLMFPSGSLYSGSAAHTSGNPVAISLIRRIDGSNMTDTQIVY